MIFSPSIFSLVLLISGRDLMISASHATPNKVSFGSISHISHPVNYIQINPAELFAGLARWELGDIW